MFSSSGKARTQTPIPGDQQSPVLGPEPGWPHCPASSRKPGDKTHMSRPFPSLSREQLKFKDHPGPQTHTSSRTF